MIYNSSFVGSATITAGSLSVGGSLNVGTSRSKYFINKINAGLIVTDASNNALIDGVIKIRIQDTNSSNTYSTSIPGLTNSISRNLEFCLSNSLYFETGFLIQPADFVSFIHTTYIKTALVNNSNVQFFVNLQGFIVE